MTKNGNKHGALSAWARQAGISPTYAYEIETGKKVPPLATAARIYIATGKRFGALAHPAVNLRDVQAVARVVKQAGQLAA